MAQVDLVDDTLYIKSNIPHKLPNKGSAITKLDRQNVCHNLNKI